MTNKYCSKDYKIQEQYLQNLLDFYNFLLDGDKSIYSITQNFNKYCSAKTKGEPDAVYFDKTTGKTVGDEPDAVYFDTDTGKIVKVSHPGPVPTVAQNASWVDKAKYKKKLNVYKPLLKEYEKALAIQKRQEQERVEESGKEEIDKTNTDVINNTNLSVYDTNVYKILTIGNKLLHNKITEDNPDTKKIYDTLYNKDCYERDCYEKEKCKHFSYPLVIAVFKHYLDEINNDNTKLNTIRPNYAQTFTNTYIAYTKKQLKSEYYKDVFKNIEKNMKILFAQKYDINKINKVLNDPFVDIDAKEKINQLTGFLNNPDITDPIEDMAQRYM